MLGARKDITTDMHKDTRFLKLFAHRLQVNTATYREDTGRKLSHTEFL